MLKFPVGTHPGAGYRLVICDSCSKKIRLKDTVLVKDKYNPQFGQLICARHVNVLNPSAQLPLRLTPETTASPELIRPQTPEVYSATLIDDRAPSAPRNLYITGGFTEGDIDLIWEGPEDNGSSAITGYLIQVARPLGSNYIVLVANTADNTTRYTLSGEDLTTDAEYQVRAINTYGTSPVSNIAYFPNNSPEVQYYLTVNGGYALTANGGEYLLVTNTF